MKKQHKKQLKGQQLPLHQNDSVNPNNRLQKEKQQQANQQKKRMRKMIIMLIMVFVYMLAELFVGIISKSLTLLGDAFHMLSDAIGLIVTYKSIKLTMKQSHKKQYTFGYNRAEVLSAFFSGSFLISTAFFLLTEAAQKFMSPKIIDQIDMCLCTSIGGIIINIIGLAMFGDIQQNTSQISNQQNGKQSIAMRGLFLHILSDFLGSVVAITAAVVQKYFNKMKYSEYTDPICSLVMIFLLINASVPLLRDAIFILMHKTDIDVKKLENQITKVENVIKIESLRVFTLAGNSQIAILKVVINEANQNVIQQQITDIFRNFNIKDVTMQLQLQQLE